MSEKNKNESNKKSSDYLYKVERVCGNGSFGIVFQAKVIQTGEVVAIKKVYQDRRYKNREYTLTKTLNHPNVIHLTHAFYTTGEKKDEIYLNLVMNYVPDNLNRINRNYVQKKEQFPIFLIKLYCFQIARALNYIHSKHICHRDIKPQNILIDPSTNKVFLCDFGSAKILNKDENNVQYICSRFYRAPELIMEIPRYDESIDIWSFACVIAELLKGKPLLKTEKTKEQLRKIMELFGGPKEEDLIGIPNHKDIAYQLRKFKAKPMAQIFPNTPKDLLDLLGKMFVHNPKKRLTPMEIMAHPFFDELRNKDVCINNGKYVIPNLFDFSEKEISRSKQGNLWTKIIPEWSEGYQNLVNFANSNN
jgi:glycogen synthase kinase 3 beta